MKIVAVCSFGVGSSVIAKMNIESILEEEGKVDVTVETADIGSISGINADIYVTTNELFDNLPDELKSKSVILDNFIDKDVIKELLDKKIAEIE